MLTCQHPDRDLPYGRMKCGYPLPCPFHTVMLDLTTKPPMLIHPITRRLTKKQRQHLNTIALKLAKGRP